MNEMSFMHLIRNATSFYHKKGLNEEEIIDAIFLFQRLNIKHFSVLSMFMDYFMSYESLFYINSIII